MYVMQIQMKMVNRKSSMMANYICAVNAVKRRKLKMLLYECVSISLLSVAVIAIVIVIHHLN